MVHAQQTQISPCHHRTISYLKPKTPLTCSVFCIAHDDPSKSAYHILHGKHNFNNQLWAPPGGRAIVHKHPQSHTSWGQKGTVAWYTRPARFHYQFYHMFIMDMKKYWICKGVCLPTFCTIPKFQPRDYTTHIDEKLFVEIVKLNKGKTKELSKHFQ